MTKRGKRLKKRVTAWFLTLVIVMSLVMVPAGEVQAADVALTYIAGQQSATVSGTTTHALDVSFGKASYTNLNQLKSTGVTKLQVSYRIHSYSQADGETVAVQPYVNASDNWKGNWLAAVTGGMETTVELDLTQFYNTNAELYNFGIQFLGATQITYEITSAKLVTDSTSGGSSSESADPSAIGQTSSFVTATITASNVDGTYHEYYLKVNNNSSESISDWIVAIPMTDVSSVQDWGSWAYVQACYTNNYLYIAPISSAVIPAGGSFGATSSTDSNANNYKFNYTGNSNVSGATVYYTTGTSSTGAFNSVVDSSTGGTSTGGSSGGSGGITTPTAKSDTTSDLGKNIDYNYAKLLQEALYFYDANMCGPDVEANTSVNWRKACHTCDTAVKYGNYTVDVSGGFHDAGDHDKFGLPQATSAAILGMGYYEYKDAYTLTGQTEHFKKILDYFCDYFERCTVVDASGNAIAFCYQVGDGGSHNLWVSAEDENIARPAYFADSSTPATDQVSAAAAALTIHYMNFGNEDYLTCAKRLFAMAKRNAKKPQNSQNGDYYKSSSCEDDYCLAAAWLYKATGDDSYMEEYNKYIGNVKMGSWPSWDEMGPYAAAYGEDKWEAFGGNVTASLDQCQNVDNGYAYLAMWASARYNCNMQFQGLLYDKHMNSDYYTSWAEGQMEFLLGNNKLNTCFVVGYNDLSSKYPHHRSASGYNGVFPDQNGGQVTQKYSLVGALVGGIKEGTYVDTANDYYYNEVALDYNAAFTGAAAALYLKNKDKSNQVIATSSDATLSKVIKTFYGATQSTTKPTDVSLNATTKEVVVGESFTLKATVEPSGASQSVTWTSSDTSVAIVSSTGKVTTKASGTATITATTVAKMESGESATATCAVTVKKPAELTSSETNLKCDSLVYGYTTGVVPKMTYIKNIGGVKTTVSSVTLESTNQLSGTHFEIKNYPVDIVASGQSVVSVTPKTGLAAGTYTDKVIITYDKKKLEIPVSVTIAKKPITVKANNASMTYGEAIPTLSVDSSYEDSLVANDTLSYQVTTTATTSSDVGTYPINLTVASNANYEITTENGTLTINPKAVSQVNFPTASALKAGQTLEDSMLTGGSTEYGSFAWKDTSIAPSRGTPSYDVVLTLNDNVVKNYSFTSIEGYNSSTRTITKSVSVNVTRADLPEVKFPTAADITYGQALKDSDFAGGSTEYGSFAWETKDYVPTENEIGTIQKKVIFTWSDASKAQYGLEDDEMTQEQMVTVKVNKQTNTNVPSTPTLVSRTANRITVSEIDGVEYSKDGVNWQASGTFAGLSAFTPYKIYARYKETTTKYAGAKCATPLQVCTLVEDVHTVDVSKLGGSEAAAYVDALRMNSSSEPTVSYADNVLTLKTSNATYTLVGDNNNLKVCVPNDSTTVVLKDTTIGQLDVSKNNATSAMNTFIQVEGTSIVSFIVSSTTGDVKISGNGTLEADYIEIKGALTLDGISIVVDATNTGKVAISAGDIAIKDSKVNAFGGEGKPAIQAESITITGGEVAATGGIGATAMNATESITIEKANVKVNVGAGSTDKAIVSDNITLKGENTITTEGGMDNLYSTTPKDENGNILTTYTVTFVKEDGKTTMDALECYAGSTIVLPELEDVKGCVIRWKEKSTGTLYQGGVSYTVKGNVTFIVDVTKIKVTKITLDSTEETLEIGDGVALAETVLPANAYDTSVTWSSSNTAVATVDAEGEVTAMAEGTAIITATANDGSGVSASCTITVVNGDIPVEKIKISGATKKVAPGKKLKLTATVYPANATNKSVKWKVSNSKYASVNSKGVVTTKKAGKGKKVTVTAYSVEDNSIVATYKISIMKNAVKKIKLSAKTKTIKKGKSVTIKAKFTPSKGISKELTWTTSNKKVATVNSKGKVTGKKKGTVKITAKAKDGSGKKATIKIKVK